MGKCIVGIDLGGTKAAAAAVELDSTPYPQTVETIPTGNDQPPEQLLAQLADLAKQVAQGREIAAVGLGAPGLLDLEQGTCVFSGNLGWREVPVARELSCLLSAPVFMDNDVRVAALGELKQGAARGQSDFIYLTVGTGIGSGIFIQGRLLRGPRYAAGEVGHMVLKPDGPACTCGSRGCLEALASATAMAREAKTAAEKSPGCLPPDLDARAIAALAASNLAAKQIWDEAMGWLGIGVANLVNIFNPALVVIGGGVSLAGDMLLTPVREKVQQLAMPVQRKHVTITLSALGDKAGVAGALELAKNGAKAPGEVSNG